MRIFEQRNTKKKNKISDNFLANAHEFSCREWKRACYLEEILLKNGKGQASRGNCRLSDTDSQSSFLTMDVTRLTRFCRCHTFFSSLAKGTFDDVLRQCNGTDATNGLLKELKLTDFKVSGGFHVVPNAEDKARFSALAEMASIMNDIFVN